MRNLDALPLILGLAAIAIGVSALFAIVDGDPEEAAPAANVWERSVDGNEIFTRSFDLSSGGGLEVDMREADVVVQSHDGSGVEVRVLVESGDMDRARRAFESMSFSAVASGNTLRVEADDDDDLEMTTVVSVPRRFDVSVKTADGDIEVGQLEGEITLRSSDGDIFAAHMAGTSASIDTSDGDITVERFEALDGRVRTSDGDVSIGAAGGSLEARSSDGDIRIEIETGVTLRVSTSDGDITLFAPSDYAADVDFSGEELSVSAEFTLLGEVDDGEVRGSLNGGGSLLTARTGDGTIELRTRGG